MNEKIYRLLLYCKDNKTNSQREISKNINVSLGAVNSYLKKCKELDFLDNNNCLTAKGEKELERFKVDNAVIMAAGMSSRFAPLSYEKPKGLLKVKGEILIERQIRQLHSAGIKDITVVVGYMADKFFYLKDKFGVKIVVNNDYYKYNNTSTLIRVKNELKNTYICSSDNYFVDNPFEEYVYKPYYAAVMIEGKSNEWGLVTDKKGLIKGIEHNPENMYCMMGHVYFDRNFSRIFSKILTEQYEWPGTKESLWETVLEKNLKELPIYIRKYDSTVIKEFDSLEELRDFDSEYLKNADSKIFNNICNVLKCKESDIINIQVVKDETINLSFSFTVNGNQYIYRHPRSGTEKFISRKSEEFSLKKAKELDLNSLVIYMDGKEGWMISHFNDSTRAIDYQNEKEVKRAFAIMRKLHDAQIESEYNNGAWKRISKIISELDDYYEGTEDFIKLFNKIEKLYLLTEDDKVKKVLCHCNCSYTSFLINEDTNEISLTDWEYSGKEDPNYDLGTFICYSNYSFKETLKVIEWYYGREMNKKELRHVLAYISIASYHWYIWAIYQEVLGKPINKSLLIWYENVNFYYNKAIDLYK